MATRDRADEADEAVEEADREAMVRDQIEARGVVDPRVLAAMRRVPRHRFVPAEWREEAYADCPLPIGHGVTISQPYIVAVMAELAAVSAGDRVLEIGAGSGYQSAVLAELGAEVFALEIIDALIEPARALLGELGYGPRVHLEAGDGSLGWAAHAPYRAILAAAAPAQVPQALKDQLAIGGRLVLPVGTWDQDLVLIRREGPDEFVEERVFPVRFVPMTGAAADYVE